MLSEFGEILEDHVLPFDIAKLFALMSAVRLSSLFGASKKQERMRAISLDHQRVWP